MLGVAVRGRDFAPDDDRDGAEAVGIISDRLWSRVFGRRWDIVGAQLETKPLSVKVIGVAPPGFEGARRGEQADLWIPTSLVRRLAPAQWSWLGLPVMLFARLGRGQTVQAVEQQIQSLTSDMPRALHLTPLSEVYGTPESPHVRNARRPLLSRCFWAGDARARRWLCDACRSGSDALRAASRRTRLRMSLGTGRPRLVLELVRDLSLIAAPGTAGGLLIALARDARATGAHPAGRREHR